MRTAERIPETMKALRIHAPNDLRLDTVAVPRITEDEVLVRVLATGICAGDIKIVDGAQMFWGGGVLPKWVDEPVTLGHEFVGEIVAIGDAAEKRTGLALGDYAVAEQIIPCGQCRYCTSGERWMCRDQRIYGSKKGVAEGSMAQFMKYVPNSVIHRVPKHVPPEQLSMIEPLSCAVHTVERAAISFDDVVVIAGMGPIGLCKLQLARRKSPKMLIALDVQPHRLGLAKRYGADHVFNPRECDVVKEVKKLTAGYGCDIYIHCSGHSSGVTQGLQMLRNHGRYVEFSVFMSDTSVDWSIIGDRKELDIRGAHISGLTGYEIAIDMLAKGVIDVTGIVTQVFELERFQEAFATAKKGTESIKVVVQSTP